VISLLIALNHGLGTLPTPLSEQARAHYTLSQYEVGGRATFAGAIFLLIALTIAKCSVVIFMQRLLARDSRGIRLLCYGLTVVFIAWGLGSILGIAINCDATWYITSEAKDKCGHQPLKWKTIAAFDVATEFMLMMVPVLIVWPLKMAKHLKIQVVSAFMFRIG
jgi:hypothetical protein